MTEKESKRLKVGERVFWTMDNTPGTVTETGYACNKIKWEDGLETIIAHDDANPLELAKGGAR